MQENRGMRPFPRQERMSRLEASGKSRPSYSE